LFDAKTQKQPKPKPNPFVAPRNTPAKVATMPDAGLSQDRVRERAYELYESRGRGPGRDQQDWLHAEQEMLKRQR